MTIQSTTEKGANLKETIKNRPSANPRHTKRNLNGILLLDKPTGLTSNAALQKVKRIFCARKAGHTGSLDPLACGLLPICFGEATKFSQFLLEADKRYIVIAKLGIKTATGDAEGETIEQRQVEKYSNQMIEKTLAQFHGAIQQVPSMYSAIKHNGTPLYKLARQGISVERKAREVVIHEMIFMYQTEDALALEISCSKGTYIRTLIEDIGEALGCGAHVTYLRRLGVGHYKEEQMVSMQKLESAATLKELDTYVLPIETSVEFMPAITLAKSAAFYLCQGQSVMAPQAPTSGYVRLYSNDDAFIGVGEILDNGKIAPKRLIGTS